MVTLLRRLFPCLHIALFLVGRSQPFLHGGVAGTIRSVRASFNHRQTLDVLVLAQKWRQGRPTMSSSISMTIGPAGIGETVSTVVRDVDPFHLSVAAAFGFGTVPLAEAAYNSAAGATEPRAAEEEFRETLAYRIADGVSSAARVYGLVVLAPPLAASLRALGANVPDDDAVAEAASGLGLTIWAALGAQSLKRYALASMSSEHPDDFEELGKISLYDRILDFVIWAAAVAFILGILSVDIGPGIMSIFTLGGIGTLVFSLASKDLAEQFVGGLLVSAWDAFDEGDEIRLGDGTEGIVARIGLFESDIRGFDNVVIRIPNSQIIRQRVSNISRIKRCQVKQTLRFRYCDRKKLPFVLEDIKAEIKHSCPQLITDGSRPFRASLYAFQDDHIEVIVNTHFLGIPPTGDEYLDNRQRVLEAISRAMDKNGVEFALPSIIYTQQRSESDKLD